jgi:predicted phage terminase large subunit-like protein
MMKAEFAQGVLEQKNIINYAEILKLNEKCRRSLVYFLRAVFTYISAYKYIHNWHIDYIVEHLHAVAQRDITRLIINVLPGAFKSTIANQAFSAFIFNSLFPNFVLRKNMKEVFRALQVGYRVSDSAGGKVTGGSADGLIYDDLLDYRHIKSKSEIEKINDWYMRMPLRQGCPITLEIVIMQRLHDKDLRGYLFSDARNKYEHCIIKSWEEEPKKHVFFNQKLKKEIEYVRRNQYLSEQLKDTILELKDSTQYQQSPTISGGNMIKEEWLILETLETIRSYEYERIVLSVGTANKLGISNYYKAILVFGIYERKAYLIDAIKKKVTFPSLKSLVNFCYEKCKCYSCSIGDKGSGISLIQELARKDNFYKIIPINPKLDKESRLIRTSDFVSAGRFIMLANASFTLEFKEELLRFPQSEYDDMADAFSQFINWFMNWENVNRAMPSIRFL